MSYDTNEPVLKNEFEKYGEIIEGINDRHEIILCAKFPLCIKFKQFLSFILLDVKNSVKVICDHMSGKSKGYGFVLFDSEEAAARALASMNNQVRTTKPIQKQTS